MTDDGDMPDLDRTFAGMLGELEDHATRLTKRQSELARQLADVDDELQRVEAVRAAMTGKNPRRPSSAARSAVKATKTQVRTERITEWARERGGEFTSVEVAEFLGVNVQGIGPSLAGMVRRGEANVRDDNDGRRLYSLA